MKTALLTLTLVSCALVPVVAYAMPGSYDIYYHDGNSWVPTEWTITFNSDGTWEATKVTTGETESGTWGWGNLSETLISYYGDGWSSEAEEYVPGSDQWVDFSAPHNMPWAPYGKMVRYDPK